MEDKKLPKKELIHEFASSKKKVKPLPKNLIIATVIMIILGVATGYIAASFSGNSSKNPVSMNEEDSKDGSISKGDTFGVDDTKAFPDSTEGVVREGGIDGEGEYHLERPGGDSQNVYMTSAAVDLSQFVGKKVKVWGQTNSAQKAGWLMDVGKVQVL